MLVRLSRVAMLQIDLRPRLTLWWGSSRSMSPIQEPYGLTIDLSEFRKEGLVDCDSVDR